MSVYKRQLQRIVKEYQREGEPWPATMAEVSEWAIGTGRYKPSMPTLVRVLSRALARALREEYFIDEKGRRVRSKHPARVKHGGQQRMLWDDMRTAPRSHMEMAFSQRRNHIVGECRQLKIDVDSYNDTNSEERPIQLVLDFTYDVAELEMAA